MNSASHQLKKLEHKNHKRKLKVMKKKLNAGHNTQKSETRKKASMERGRLMLGILAAVVLGTVILLNIFGQ